MVPRYVVPGLCDILCALQCHLSVGSVASIPGQRQGPAGAGSERADASEECLTCSQSPYREEVRLQVTLLGAGDSLTLLSCLYVMETVSGSVLQSVGWLHIEVMEKSMVIVAGFLQDMDCWFPNPGGGRVMCLFPNLCFIAADGGLWRYFLGSTEVSEAPGHGLGCLQFFCHASSDASWALWAQGELVIFSWVLPAYLGRS